MSKLGMLAAGAVGYVLGARAGRERYDQIVNQARRFWTNPQVQRAASQAQDVAKDAAPVVVDKVGDVAKHAAGAAASAIRRDGGDQVDQADEVDQADDATAESPVATRDEGAGSTPISHL
jgi:SLT domain-containing protein